MELGWGGNAQRRTLSRQRGVQAAPRVQSRCGTLTSLAIVYVSLRVEWWMAECDGGGMPASA